jgi:proton-dependent oligopeptide transporter, POT family
MHKVAMALISNDPDKGFFGHPRGLAPLFLTEMWERFSFYGMRALLVLYLTKHFLYSDGTAGFIYASYAALNYAMPIIGGLIADRYLGNRKAVTLGAVLLVFGHIGMAFEGPSAFNANGFVIREAPYDQIMFLSLALIIVGVGFLKPTIADMVGKLYPERGDPRRDPGYTIFYMSVNVGAFASSLVCAYLGETYGWKYGFGLAGIGMVFGLIAFLRGKPWYRNSEAPNPERLRARTRIGLSLETVIYVGAIFAVLVNWQLVQRHEVVGYFLQGVVAASMGGLLIFSFAQCTRIERARMAAILLMLSFSVVFWALFEQAGSSLTLFADRNTDRSFLGMELTAGSIQAFNPLFIILLAPLFSWGWVKLAAVGLEPSTPLKFGIGIIQVGLGFGVLVFGASLAGDDSQTALLWLALAYLLHTTGELCVSPVGISMITRLSVARISAMMVGVFYLSISLAHHVAGMISASASVQEEGGQAVSAQESLSVYVGVFNDLFLTAVGVGLFVCLISPFIKRLMHLGAPDMKNKNQP